MPNGSIHTTGEGGDRGATPKARNIGVCFRVSPFCVHNRQWMPDSMRLTGHRIITSWGRLRGYPLVYLPCKHGIFTKRLLEDYYVATRERPYCGGCWSRSQGLGLHRDAQGAGYAGCVTC